MCILEFYLSDQDGCIWNHRRFRISGVEEAVYWDIIGNEEGPFSEYIEEVEFGEGQTNGTVDQTGTDEDGERIWTLTSSEIENQQLFIEQTIATIQTSYGWTLEEIV